jgi:hypothetical protein
MSQKMSRGEVQDLLSKFAIQNPKYRQALLTDPKGLIEKQLNASLGGFKVKAVADTADTVHVVVPYVASSGELSDADLEKVAGGKGDTSGAGQQASGNQSIAAECNLKAGAGATGNTVTGVQL